MKVGKERRHTRSSRASSSDAPGRKRCSATPVPSSRMSPIGVGRAPLSDGVPLGLYRPNTRFGPGDAVDRVEFAPDSQKRQSREVAAGRLTADDRSLLDSAVLRLDGHCRGLLLLVDIRVASSHFPGSTALGDERSG